MFRRLLPSLFVLLAFVSLSYAQTSTEKIAQEPVSTYAFFKDFFMPRLAANYSNSPEYSALPLVSCYDAASYIGYQYDEDSPIFKVAN